MTAAVPRGHALRPGAVVIAYGAPVIAALAYLTFWPFALNPILHLYRPIDLPGPLPAYAFIDLDAVLDALVCARQGVDVTVPNACMGGGLFQYSPLLLAASALPVGPWLRVPCGIGLDALFLLSLYALPQPRNWQEFWCFLLAAMSCGTFYVLETGNIDIVLFPLVLLAAHLLLRGAGARLAGYAVILVAAAIKFYPACLMALAARERPARLVPIAFAALAAAVLFAVVFAGQLGHILPRLPHDDPFGTAFGATNLPRGLAMLLAGDDADRAPGRAIRFVSMTGLIVLAAMIAAQLAPLLLPALRTMAPRPRILLVAGALMMTFCFLAAQNFMHRQIFLMLTLPGLWGLARGAPQAALRARFRLAAWVVVGIMWSYFLHLFLVAAPAGGTGGHLALNAAMALWVVQEALWWWLISLFAAVILCFLWDSPVLAGWRVTGRTRNGG